MPQTSVKGNYWLSPQCHDTRGGQKLMCLYITFMAIHWILLKEIILSLLFHFSCKEITWMVLLEVVKWMQKSVYSNWREANFKLRFFTVSWFKLADCFGIVTRFHSKFFRFIDQKSGYHKFMNETSCFRAANNLFIAVTCSIYL